MKKFSLILCGLGLLMFTGIIAWYGADDIIKALAMCGTGLIPITMSHFLPLFLDSAGWKRLIISDSPPSLLSLVRLRWIGESINSLLPALQIGGDMVRAGLLKRKGVQGSVAGASVVAEITVTLVTQIIFTLFGIAMLFISGDDNIVISAMTGITVMAALTGLFAFFQKKGLLGKVVQMLSRLGAGDIMQAFTTGAARFDHEIRRLYAESHRLVTAGLWRLAGWIAGAVEVWLALHFMGHAISIGNAVMLESLGQAVRAAAFMVPGALGIQEGGFVVLGSVIGITPELSIGLSLAKRVRELSLGIPGLLVWQASEGKRFLNKRFDKFNN